MGNINTIKDKDGNLIAEADMGLACFSMVVDIIQKYNPTKVVGFPRQEELDELLNPCYEKGEDFEVVQLLTFMSDKSMFTKEDIKAFEEAIEKCKFTNRDKGPKKMLRNI